MTAAASPVRTLKVAIDPASGRALPEIRYVLSTVLGTAGFAVDLAWYEETASPDVYYGPRQGVEASITIPAVPWDFGQPAARTPSGTRQGTGGLELVFPGGPDARSRREGSVLRFGTDALFGAFWLLTAPEEPLLERDRWDNLDAASTSVVRLDVLERAPVSVLASVLRDHLEGCGFTAEPWPWEANDCAVAFTHDVDYPEIIRWIEVLRALAGRRPGLALKAAFDRAPFWCFDDWIELADSLGGRPAFYFMAERGSLREYARGRPDAFYDIGTPRFGELFAQLRDAGCEIGLHASYQAHLGADRFRAERERLEAASGGVVPGNRHHYWHLDPDDPAETLHHHATSGLTYDSSLAFETHPGFRRGICHPFRAFHPRRRESIGCVQLPPAWMDDHFHRRREINGIRDPEATAARILRTVKSTAGALVLDYHPRGMNEDFFPAYGAWLRDFARERLHGVDLRTPVSIADVFLERESRLAEASTDRTGTER